MNADDTAKKQVFFDHICNYEYITTDGRLILEPFGVYLSHCFGHDDILNMSPQPKDVYLLLLDMIEDRLGDSGIDHYVRIVKIKDWEPHMAYIYPEKTMTYIHLSALVELSHDWIYNIGHILMGIPEPSMPIKYFAWAKEEWKAVFTFINGYHNALNLFIKKFDKDNIDNYGCSLLEALHLAKKQDIDYDEATKVLKTRNKSYLDALNRIKDAMNNGYFLEAITLQECLMSNCIYNFLSNTGSKLTRPSFCTLLKVIKKSSATYHEKPIELFSEIDAWRMSRNRSIHGFIVSRSDNLDESGDAFRSLSESTANEGLNLCKQIVSWYKSECVNFVRHEFPTTQDVQRN
ncbi:hypothetical protein ACWPKS_02730 [Coraliomargarita sp. W4R72]